MNEDLIDTTTSQSIQESRQPFCLGRVDIGGVIHPERSLHRVDSALRIAAIIEAIAVQQLPRTESGRGLIRISYGDHGRSVYWHQPFGLRLADEDDFFHRPLLPPSRFAANQEITASASLVTDAP